MDSRITRIKHHFLHHLVFYLTLIIGWIVSFFSQQFTTHIDVSSYFQDPLPKNIQTILFHNLQFILIYSIPFLGHLHYVYNFTIIFITLGLSYNYLGFLNTWIHLLHLPLEVYAYALILQNNTKPKLKYFITAILLLIISAVLEFKI